ncbi:MAG TPA: hypothetical protein VIG74_06820 [Alphaproteobacteria bacterium]|jgi:hypothetical protein
MKFDQNDLAEMFEQAVVALEGARMSDGRDAGNAAEAVMNIFAGIAVDAEMRDGTFYMDFFAAPSLTGVLQRCSSPHEAINCLNISINRHIGSLGGYSMMDGVVVDNDRQDNQVCDVLAVRDAAVDYLKTLQP